MVWLSGIWWEMPSGTAATDGEGDILSCRGQWLNLRFAQRWHSQRAVLNLSPQMVSDIVGHRVDEPGT